MYCYTNFLSAQSKHYYIGVLGFHSPLGSYKYVCQVCMVYKAKAKLDVSFHSCQKRLTSANVL